MGGNVTSDEATYTFDQVKIGGVPTPDEPIWGLKYTFWLISSLASVIMMTTLYNAMLVVAASLSNPFQQDRLSFPGLWYEKGVDEDARFFHNMALNEPWKYTQKFRAVKAHPGIDDTSSDDSAEGPQDLTTLIRRMKKHGSTKSSLDPKNYLSPTDSVNNSGRPHSPNNVSGGKGHYSPYNTLRSG